jgi:hypothetical protein
VADVQAHTQKLLADMAAKEASIVPNGEQVTAAAVVPDFSKATAAVNDEGQPILSGQTVAPTQQEMHPEGGRIQTESQGDALTRAIAEAKATPEPKAAPERDDQGRFVSDQSRTAATTEPEVDPAETTAAQILEQRAQAKPAAPTPETPPAAAATPSLDGYEEVTYEDPDTGDSFVVLAKKDHAARVKQGYVRRSLMHRNNSFMSEAKPVLEPLIQSGQMRELLPLIQLAQQDPEYARFVIEGYNRKVSGLPLVHEATSQSTPQSAPQAAPQVAQANDLGFNLSLEEDPYAASLLSPVLQRLEALDARTRALDEERARAAEAQQRQQALENQARQTIGQMHQELTRAYPGEWTGDVSRDDRLIRQTLDYARNSGMAQMYGMTVPTLMLAYATLRSERANATASPAVAAMAEAERAVAQTVAASAAQTLAPGTSRANTVTPKKAPPPLAPTRDASGRPTPINDFTKAALRHIAAKQA